MHDDRVGARLQCLSDVGMKVGLIVCACNSSNSSDFRQSWHLHDKAPCRRSWIVNLLQAGHGPWG